MAVPAVSATAPDSGCAFFAIANLLSKEREADLERPVEKCERLLLGGRGVVQPVEQDAEVVDPERLWRPPRCRRQLAAARRLLEQSLDEREIASLQRVRRRAERPQPGAWLERVEEGRPDEPFVRREELELRLDEREQLFFERRLAEPRVALHRGNRVVYLLLEEVEGDVFLGAEVVEHGALRDFRLASDGFRRRRVEAFVAKERERGGDDSRTRRGFVLLAAPGFRRECTHVLI